MFGRMNRRLKKRVLSFVMALSMVVTLLDASTMTALAAEKTDSLTSGDELVQVVTAEPGLMNEVEDSSENDEIIESDAGENQEAPAEAEEEVLEAEEQEDESLLETLGDAVEELLNNEKTYADFTEDEVIAKLSFGSDITEASVYDESKGYGFDRVEFPNEARGWVGSIYYPRVAVNTVSDASYVKNADGMLAISSKVWKETEKTGYGVYTYENTSVFQYDLENADYSVEVTLKNPTSKEYTASVETEDITKASGIKVAPGATVSTKVTACLVDGKLSIKFLGEGESTVYVSDLVITRLATNPVYENTNGIKKPTVFIASDSTVQSYDSYYYPQTGWGQVLAEFFGDGNYQEVTSKKAGYGQSKTYEVSNAVIENRAIGGRSSSSFVTEGKLDDLLEDVAPGDFLLIQWGHNDATSSRPNRYVSASEDADGNGKADFEQWIQYYIDGAYQRGATPVLVTPVARYSYTTDSNGELISYASNFEAYRQVMIKMAKEQGLALIDLTQRSIDVANSFGIDGGKSLWLHVAAGDYVGAYAGGATDSTHLQWYGAYKFAQQVAKGIVEAGASDTYKNENYSSDENKAKLAALAGLVDLRAAAKAPGAVSGLTVGTVGASSASISWQGNAESELYYIYRAAVDSEEAAASYKFPEDAQKFSVSRNTKYTDTNCLSGRTYVYAIRGFNSLGLGEFSENLVVTTKAEGLKFDFNYNNSTTQEGWIGVNQTTKYDSQLGYGYIKAPGNGRVRGNNGTVSADLADMAGDFHLGAGEFAVDLPNGDYEITIYAADLLAGTSTIKPSYNAEGVEIGGISCKQALGSLTAQVRVSDGQLNLVVGGTNQYINGLKITEILKAPTGLVETEASVVNGKYTALLSFNGIEEAVGYNYYIKGTTDTEFKRERTFDLEKYALGVTEYGAISVNLGENYQYYVTAYTADGTESAPSNTITVEALLKDVSVPNAPENVVCADPTEDETNLHNTITIAWDPSVVENSAYPVVKYIIYRSDRAEGTKGFVEYVKVGESDTTSFTDTDPELATNIHYYYKVCGANAGGAGELSEACETPVTGKLVPGNQEVLKDRAVYAIKLSDEVKAYKSNGDEITDGVYVSWRAFEEEFDVNNKLTTEFTVYVNDEVVAESIKATNIVLTNVSKRSTIKVVGSSDSYVNGGLVAKEIKPADKQYVEMKLNKPEDETMPNNTTCTFTANDMSVGDVDGDGVLDLIVKWYPSNAQDNSKGGYTGKTIIDAYKVDWNTGEVSQFSRVDLGVNIRSGAHYTQFQVWDFDGDGKAELAVKTADGSTCYSYESGKAALVDYVGACSTEELPVDTVSTKNDYRNASGYVLDGPEYFSMINLEDGTILDTVDYTPARGTVSKWGDGYGNRVDRFLSATAYLDGIHPFAVMCRGYYTRTALTAYGTKDTDNDNVGDKIYTYWAYDTDNGDGPEGQGNHNLAVADVDNDGKDEIVYGSSCYDHNGTLKYSTGMGHGDAMHVSDWIASNPGLEVMEVHEEQNQRYQVEIHDAETGEVIVGYPVKNTDVGRGVAADIDPTEEGAEFWASNGPSGEGTGEWDSTDSSVIATSGSSTTEWNVLTYGSSPAANATLYWDGDLLAEIQDHTFNKGGYYPLTTVIAKWNYETGKQETILETDEVLTSNGTKGNVGLIADLTGDFRDEFIARCTSDDSKVRLYETTYVTDYVIPCALDDLQYREGVAWENVAYNQPTHTSYLISKGLVTAKLSKADAQTDSATIRFTAANDGVYGNEITAYAIYRDGELIDTVKVEDLAKDLGTDTPEAPVKPEKIELKFDFGAGEVAEGYTGVKCDSLYTEEKGYGFTDLTAAGNGTYNSGDENNKDVLDDNVLFYDKSGASKEFKVDLPNGNYTVTFSAGGYNFYNAITAEGNSIETNKFRNGRGGGYNTVSAEVAVEDGQLNIVSTISKNGYFNIIFSGLTITANDYEDKLLAYEKAKVDYDAAVESIENNAPYIYTDNKLASNTEYSYQVAAVVNNNVSYKSKACKVSTLISISEVKEFELENIVAGTKVSTSAVELLPATVTVVDEENKEQEAVVVWDVTNLDITTPGEYEVVGYIEGYSSPVVKKVTVVANEIKGVEKTADVSLIAGSQLNLPKTITVEYTNGSKDAVAVTWDTSKVDVNTMGSYEVVGTLEGFDIKANIKVNVVSDYPVSVDTVSIEVAVNDSIVTNLPKTVPATMASKNKSNVSVSWKTEGVDTIDTSLPGSHMIHGTVEGLTGDVLCDVTVAYKALYKFDFGINKNIYADGFTTVTVNSKGGKKTAADLDIQYLPERGYGFEKADAVIEGRTETVEGSGNYPTNVTTDFALMTGQTFVVDVPNGEYLVQVMTNCGIGSTSATVEVEGVAASMSANKSFTVKDYTVTVEDGQLTVVDKSSLARIGAIIVRQIKEEKKLEPVDLSEAEISLSATSLEYAGKALTPEVTIISGELALTEGVDYTVEYKNNVNAGTAKVIIKGISDNCKNKAEREFKITQRSITNCTVKMTEWCFNLGGSVTSYIPTAKYYDSFDGGETNVELSYTNYRGGSITYANDTEVIRMGKKVKVKAGTKLNILDKVPENTLMKVTTYGRGNYKGTFVGTYRTRLFDESTNPVPEVLTFAKK